MENPLPILVLAGKIPKDYYMTLQNWYNTGFVDKNRQKDSRSRRGRLSFCLFTLHILNIMLLLDLTKNFYHVSVLKQRLKIFRRIYQMKKSKQAAAILLAAMTMVTGLTGCGKSVDNGNSKNSAITVITRESGSGTRGAFIELFGIEEKNTDGKKVDNTISSAEETNSTAVMITSVEGNESAIGYISLGALKSNVKALKVDGVEATTDNVKSGSYKVARPFNVAVKSDASDAAKEFINYIMSKEGQEIISKEGYIGDDSAAAYQKKDGVSGKITVGGSSSVSPVMEKLIEAYAKVNSDITIELQQSDSTTGMTNAIAGTYDIGMASRELKDEEKAELTATTIAMDGIAVIVNKTNELSNITSDQVKGIYTGTITKWADVK